MASDEMELSTRVGEVLNRWPTAGLAVAVVRDRSLAWSYGHGVADAGSNTRVTEDTVFRIASITKTITSIAVMQLWEQGLVDLDAPANDYLRAYRLIAAKAGFRPATVRHLLTHTAGVPAVRTALDLFRPALGWEAPRGCSAPSLADYYRGGLRVDVEPGTKWAYSNHGFATLGQIVEDVSELPFDRYLRERVFGPLGMERGLGRNGTEFGAKTGLAVSARPLAKQVSRRLAGRCRSSSCPTSRSRVSEGSLRTRRRLSWSGSSGWTLRRCGCWRVSVVRRTGLGSRCSGGRCGCSAHSSVRIRRRFPPALRRS